MAYKGLYGQPQGNENRSDADNLAERIADNAVVEGAHVAALKRMVKEKDWRNFNIKVNSLRSQGFSPSRIDAMTRSATYRAL